MQGSIILNNPYVKILHVIVSERWYFKMSRALYNNTMSSLPLRWCLTGFAVMGMSHVILKICIIELTDMNLFGYKHAVLLKIELWGVRLHACTKNLCSYLNPIKLLHSFIQVNFLQPFCLRSYWIKIRLPVQYTTVR